MEKSYADLLRSNFRLFIRHVWTHVLQLPAPTKVQDDIARFLEDGPSLRAIQGYRGVGKSFLTCAYVVWCLWNDPQHRILIVSATATAAEKNANLIRQIIYHDSGAGLWDHLHTREGQRGSIKAFDVGPALTDRQPSVSCVGIGGQLPNNRATLLIADDVEIPGNSGTETMREKLRESCSEFTKILKPEPKNQIIYLGTPQSQDSIYADLPHKGYRVRVWTARYPLKGKLANYGDTLAPMLVADIEADPSLCKPDASQLGGAPTDPQRFDDRALRVSELDATSGSWTLHYMLDTQLSDAERYPLKTRDLIVMDIDPRQAPVAMSYGSSDEQLLDFVSPGFTGDRFYGPIQKSISGHWVDYTGSVMHVDPSGSGSDETAYVVTKYLEGRIYVRAWGGFRDGTSEATLDALAELAKTEEVREVVIEDNFGDGLYRQMLQPFLHRRFSTRWRCGLSGFKVTKQKELRIIGALEPTMKQHRLVMSKDVIQSQLGQGDYNGLYQMCRMTGARGAVKHDDRIDVLAQAVDYWKAFMNADILKSEANAQAKAAREFEKKFFANTPLARMFDNRPKRGQGRRLR